MKKYIVTLIFIFLLSAVIAQQVSLEKARMAGSHWYQAHFKISNINQGSIINEIFAETINRDTLMYVFNFLNGGYLILSADAAAYPVLAYSYTGKYDPGKLPPPVSWLLTKYKEQIANIKQHSLHPNSLIKTAWFELNRITSSGLKAPNSVNPLLTSCWDQGTGWNSFCPVDQNGPGGHVWAGCDAVAMAQVMNYWTYPTIGQGNHTDSDPPYGDLYVDFGATEYDWENMPDYSNNNNISQLLYHCGVSDDMAYGPNWSSSNLSNDRNALVSYFKYNPNASYNNKGDYSDADWETMLRTELDNSRPVVYRGDDNAPNTGHAWVVDGYEGTNYFHMNWGWSCSYNDYFYLSSLNPGSDNLNFNQEGIFNLLPNVPCGETLSSPNTTGVFEDRCNIILNPGFSTQPNSTFRARVIPYK